jgi:hypothetical protein
VQDEPLDVETAIALLRRRLQIVEGGTRPDISPDKPDLRPNLYWVEREDHDEDFWVLAKDTESAQEFCIRDNRYAGKAKARLVLNEVEVEDLLLPRFANAKDLKDASLEALPAGAKYLHIVSFQGRLFGRD